MLAIIIIFVMVVFNKGCYDDDIMIMGINDVNIVTIRVW